MEEMNLEKMNIACKTMKKNKDDNFRKLLITCTYNIKGLTPKNIIQDFLPIKIQDLLVYIKDDVIIFEKENKKIGEIWTDTNCYSNLEILRNITPIYGIKCKDDSILELMKYRNKIILMLL